MELKFAEDEVNLKNFREYLLGSGIRVVLYGEFHARHEEIQEELIRSIRPEYLLHEFLGNFRFESKKQIREALEFYEQNQELCKESFDPIIGFRCYSENEHVYRWALKYGLKLVGCDLSFEERKKYDDIEDERIEWKVSEKRMGETVRDISKLTKEPILTVVGDTHLRSSSELYKLLNNEVYLIRPIESNEDEIAKKDSGLLLGRRYNSRSQNLVL